MVTIFSTPRQFKGIFDRIQRTAIESWLNLPIKPQIILFNDETRSAAGVAKKYGVQLISRVAHNQHGSLLADDVFRQARSKAVYPIMAHINTDIILTNDLFYAVKKLANLSKFLMMGQRWDMDNVKIDFKQSDWELRLKRQTKSSGHLHSIAGMDYWVFPKRLDFKLPHFVVGRPCVDSWLVYRARSWKVPVVDTSSVVTIVHQNHPTPKSLPTDKVDPVWQEESQTNLRLGGGPPHMFSLLDANWQLTPSGLRRPTPNRQRVLRQIITLPVLHPWAKPYYDLTVSAYRAVQRKVDEIK